MKRSINTIYIYITIAVLGFLGVTQTSHAANAVVGTGTAASCTETAFDSALLTASVGGGTITFNCGPAPTTIQFSIVKLVTLGNVTIDGANLITLNAGNNDRHFFAGPGITFHLKNITLRDGNSLVGGGAIEASGATVILDGVQLVNNYSSVSGGAIYCYDGTLTIRNSLFENNGSGTGGAVYNDGCAVGIDDSRFLTNEALDPLGRGGAIANFPPGTLTLSDSLLQGNSAFDGGAIYNDTNSTAALSEVRLVANEAGHGGGIENSGTLTIVDSLLQGNKVTGSGGGLWNFGGAAEMERTTVSDNEANDGGGINSYGPQLRLTDVNIIDNTTQSHGGGIYHAGGTVFISNATISGNRATDTTANGGGIYQNSDDNLTLTSVTLARNEAGNFGGGLYHFGRYAVLTNVTIGENSAGVAGDAIYEDSPMTPANPGVVQIANSVLFGSSNNCAGGLFDSLGHNISHGSCAPLVHAADLDNFAGNLRLGALAFNGGGFPMNTYLPQSGSPLVNAADPGLCPSLDQRSEIRAGICDIGAVEYDPNAPRLLYLPMIVR